MRIAWVTETWLPTINGVVTRLAATCPELTRRGHQVLVIAPAGCDEPLDGVHVASMPSMRIRFIYGGQPWGLPLPRVRHLLHDFRPDLVHAVNPVLLGWSGVAYARLRGVPLVCSYHTQVARYARFYHLGFAGGPAQALVGWAHRLANVNVATSRNSCAQLAARGIPNVGLWPGGVDADLFHPDRADPGMRARLSGDHPERRLALYIGRLAAEKGIERLLPASEPGGEWHLCLVGDGPAGRELRRRFAGRQATFVGALAGEELAAAYASADLFAFPSTTDTLGLTLLEALASGLPVVAARTPAAAEVLGDAPGTALVDPTDGASLLSAMERAMAGAPDRATVAATSRVRIATWAHATDRLLSFYAEAVNLVRARRAV